MIKQEIPTKLSLDAKDEPEIDVSLERTSKVPEHDFHSSLIHWNALEYRCVVAGVWSAVGLGPYVVKDFGSTREWLVGRVLMSLAACVV